MSHFTRTTTNPSKVTGPSTSIAAHSVTSQLPQLPNNPAFHTVSATSGAVQQMGDDHDYDAIPDHYPLSVHMTAGSIAGVVEHVAMYPVDFVKVC